MEQLARNQYAQTDERDPIDCSLFYLALRKKNVLLGLWRSAGWHKEHGAMVKFLAHDFRESRWRTAASKNAYALLAKQRYGKQFQVDLRLTRRRVCSRVFPVGRQFEGCCECVSEKSERFPTCNCPCTGL